MKRILIGLLILGFLCVGLASFVLAQETIEGKVICLGCTLKKAEGAKANCSIYGHKNGLKTADGKIWSFLENDKSTGLINDHSYAGKEIKITGRKFDNANVIEVSSFKITSSATAPEASTHHKAPEARSHVAPEASTH